MVRGLRRLLSGSYGAAGQGGKALALVLVLWAGAAAAEPVRIVALGDSLTQGYGLPPEDGFVPRMQAWLDAHDVEAELINAGVSGDTSAGGLARVEWSLSGGADGMIVALGGNDLLRGIDPDVTRDNLRGILEAAQERDVEVLLIGLRASGNFGADYKAEFDAIYPDLAERFDAILGPTWFSALGRPGDYSGDVMQADGIHPNAAGVERIVGKLGPSVARLAERARQ